MKTAKAITCPECRSEVHREAWICPFCEYILDPSVLEDEDGSTSPVADSFETSDGAPEAVILGDVTVDPDDFQLMPGAGTDNQGRTSTFLFYTTGATSRIVRPDAVPRLSEATRTHRSPTTPYEDFVLSLVDGRRSVRTIQKASGLSPQEVMISLLTLIDKRIVEVAGTESKRYRVEPISEPMPPEEPTVAQLAPVVPAMVVPSELVGEYQDEITEHSDAEAQALSSAASPVHRSEVLDEPPLEEVDPDAFMDELTPDGELEPAVSEPAAEPDDTEDRMILPGPLAKPTAPEEEVVIPSEVEDPDVEEAAVVRVMPERDARQPARESTAAKRRRKEAVAQARKRAGEVEAVHEPSPEVAAPALADKLKERPLTPVDPLRMAKAQKLYEQALKDKAAGNLISAKMNLKLALTFDPTNPMFRQALEEIAKNSPEQAASRAKLLYDKATTAERLGNVDEAILLLEQALGEAKDAAYFNRLGVLLATRKREFQRAQELLEEALKRSPGNATYEQNMGKILQLAAKAEVEAREDRGPKKRGLLGFLGRKK